MKSTIDENVNLLDTTPESDSIVQGRHYTRHYVRQQDFSSLSLALFRQKVTPKKSHRKPIR